MPQIPIIIPLIVTGVFIGRMWPKMELKGMWRKTALAAAVSGLTNGAYSWALRYLGVATGRSLPTGFPEGLGVAIPSTTSTISTTNSIISVISSGLFGSLVVFIVFLSAAVMVRYRRRKELEPEE